MMSSCITKIEILRKEEFREFSESVPAEPALAARSAPALSGERRLRAVRIRVKTMVRKTAH